MLFLSPKGNYLNVVSCECLHRNKGSDSKNDIFFTFFATYLPKLIFYENILIEGFRLALNEHLMLLFSIRVT